MVTSLILCTMKSLPVLNKNSNTQGCGSLLEVGENNAKPITKKITKVKIHRYSQTKNGIFLACRAKIWPQFWSCFALLLYRILASFCPNSYRFLPVCQKPIFQGKAMQQSDFPEYTPLGIQILPSNLEEQQIKGLCIRAQQSLQYVIK